MKSFRPRIEPLEPRDAPAAQLDVPAGLAFADSGVLFVASRNNGVVFRFDAEGVPAPKSGYGGATFVPPGTNVSPSSPTDMVVDSSGQLLVASAGTNNILVFNATTGKFIKTLAGPGKGVSNPRGLAIGPDGSLYVANAGSHSVLRFDIASGILQGKYQPTGIAASTFLPTRIIFGPDGDCYVSDYTGDRVLRFDGDEGIFLDVFVSPTSGLDAPTGLAFDPDGNLYVASGARNQILKYDGHTGAHLQAFVDGSYTFSPKGPADIAFGPNGNLFVTCANINKVREFDASSGLFVEDYVGAITPTNTYLRALDRTLNRWTERGADYLNPYFSPLRLGKPLNLIDTTYDFDFARLAQVQAWLAGVSRPVALKAIFQKVVAGAITNTEKHLSVLEFLQRVTVHSSWLQPMNPDRTVVSDPLVLLELGEMRCGHVSSVAVDLFRSVGYQARMVQLGGHICAEVYYDGGWHYLDADLYGGGQIARLPNGAIPSIVQLSQRPQLLNAVFSTEPNLSVTLPGLAYYMGYFYFDSAAYSSTPGYYVKNTTVAQDATMGDYGWSKMVFVADGNRILRSGLPVYAPAAPRLNGLSITDNGDGTRLVVLGWSGKIPTLTDPMNNQLNIKEYRVFIGSSSRGWNYMGNSMNLPIELKSSLESWKPDDYDSYYQLPPADQVIAVTSTRATFTLANDQDYFISVMPVDWYGSRIGRQLFHLSEEILIRSI